MVGHTNSSNVLKFLDDGIAQSEQTNVLGRVRKVENHLYKMGETGGVDQNYIDKELEEVGETQNNIMEQFTEYQNRNLEQSRVEETHRVEETNHRTEDPQRSTRGTTPGTKNSHKKPPELEGDVNHKGFDAWNRKLMDYLTLSGLDKYDQNVQIPTLRGFLSKEMYNKMRFAMGVEDGTKLTLDKILTTTKKFIRAKRNIALDRVELSKKSKKRAKT